MDAFQAAESLPILADTGASNGSVEPNPDDRASALPFSSVPVETLAMLADRILVRPRDWKIGILPFPREGIMRTLVGVVMHWAESKATVIAWVTSHYIVFDVCFFTLVALIRGSIFTGVWLSGWLFLRVPIFYTFTAV